MPDKEKIPRLDGMSGCIRAAHVAYRYNLVYISKPYLTTRLPRLKLAIGTVFVGDEADERCASRNGVNVVWRNWVVNEASVYGMMAG